MVVSVNRNTSLKMVHSFSPSWLSLSFLVVLVLFFGIIRKAKSSDILDDVCPKTINPQLCFHVLKNDPYVYKGDIHNLVSISLSIAQDNTTSTYNLVKSLLEQPIKDPNLKTQLTNCLNNYKDAGDKLESCNDLFRTSDYRKISLLASAALSDSRACDQGFGEPPAQLKQLSQTVQEFSDLVSVIAYDLK